MPSSRCRCGGYAIDLPQRAWHLPFAILSDGSAIACRLNGYKQGRGLRPCDRDDKAVAAPRHRLDTATHCSPIIEDAAQRRDLHVQVAVFDRRTRPDGLHDLGSRDEIPWPFNQHAENVERARTDRHWSENTALIPPEQNTGAPFETEALE